MVSITSEIASLDSSIPPRTHCSAATSWGGVRSKLSPRGAISATLTSHHLPVDHNTPGPPLLRRPHPVVLGRCDSLLRPAGAVQSCCAQACGQPVQTRRPRCAQPGDTAGDYGGGHAAFTVTACAYAIHRVCAEKTARAIFRGRGAPSYPHTEGDVKREIRRRGTGWAAGGEPGRRPPGTRGPSPANPRGHVSCSPRIRVCVR